MSNEACPEYEEERMKVCGLCGHIMTLERCGSASSANGIALCHHDTHSCYHRWTVYLHRVATDADSGSLSEDEEAERSGRPR